MNQWLLGLWFTQIATVWAGVPSEYIHEAGTCMIRGQCGKESFFGPELPCLYNGKAVDPDTQLRKTLVEVCGDRFDNGPVCCDQKQLESLRDNLKKAENLIASCPACNSNFINFFCSFTCSPDQSLFLEIEETNESNTGETVVTHLSHYVSETSSDGFFDSCKNVKFSATNGYVMDLIGGGAKNSSSFLRFLGHKSLFGSPIQIDYPEQVPPEQVPSSDPTWSCNDSDPAYRCACVDCPQACPQLRKVSDPRNTCKVGILPCLSFAMLMVYISGLLAFIAGYLGHLTLARRLNRQSSRLQLSTRDGDSSDDENLALLGPSENVKNTYIFNRLLSRIFYNLGFSCAQFPYATIGISVLASGLLSLGWLQFAIETNPERLWVSPQSPAAQEKAFFDQTFGPFYRTQQIFLVNDTLPTASVVSYDNLNWWFDLEKRITSIVVGEISYEDVCFNPTGEACVIQSVTGYWQGDFANVDEVTWREQLENCAEQPGNFDCLPTFQQPLKPNMVLGDFDRGILESKAFVSSIVLANSLNVTIVGRAALWEEQLKNLLLEAQLDALDRGLRLTFSTELSLEEELNKSTNTDAKIVLISYVAMFLYASVALGGSFFNGKRSFVDSKFSLGFLGILIVLLSVSASVGLFSFFGIKVTLIIAEVIPFLVLAVGVDNIFLLCHEFDRINTRYSEKSIEERVASTMARMGPSILLSATSEVAAFSLGTFVDMPAVRNFAAYAAGAVLFDAALQLTMFPAALALDRMRVESSRVDCMPLLRINSLPTAETDHEGFLPRIIRRKYAPYLLRPYVKLAVIIIFGTFAALSVAMFPKIQLGLDQKIALPRDSYLIDYFEDLERYFGSGPPVYFVVQGSNITNKEVQEATCGRFTACQEFSMANILEQERKRPEVSYMFEPAASWLDDFFYWLNPQLESCCRVKRTDHSVFCTPDESERQCQSCFSLRDQPWNITLAGMPEGSEFIKYAQAWLDAPSSEDCPIAGKAPYSDTVILDVEHTTVAAFHARSFHTPLRTQSDFIHSYAAARRISDEISESTGLKVFPYAVHYIFFDQYASIIKVTMSLVGSALAVIFVIAAIFLGSLTAAGLVTLTVAMIVIDVAGIMAIWDINLNALSLVNLVICVGIGVEFCSHLARSYMVPTSQFVSHVVVSGQDREQRVWNALISVGGSVFSGITMCKLVGIIVLAFTRSKIFEVYYFRMWLALIFIAAAHGLIFLPVVFSILGPEGYVQEEIEEFGDAQWADSAGTRYTNALLAHRSENNGDDETDSL